MTFTVQECQGADTISAFANKPNDLGDLGWQITAFCGCNVFSVNTGNKRPVFCSEIHRTLVRVDSNATHTFHKVHQAIASVRVGGAEQSE